MQKEKLCISNSGGRTSAYMTKMILDNWSDRYDITVTFANTGLEHEKTLEFVNNCDIHFGFNTVWLESIVHHGERVACTHKIVDFKSATRGGELFEQAIIKYGIPNINSPHCTRDLKLDPIRSYVDSIGFKNCSMAVGIRWDEDRRVSKQADKYNIIYPLIYDWQTTKRMVLEYWGRQSFDLGINEFEGNCQGCFKKSFTKHFMQIDRDPSVYDFFRKMEKEHQDKGPDPTGITNFFREENNTDDLFAKHSELSKHEQYSFILSYGTEDDADNPCSQSCEIFETEVRQNG